MHALIKGFQHVFCSDSHRASHRRLAHRLALAVLSIAALVATSPYARADGDPPSLDPRANALGGGGITFSAGSAGLGINPSLMQYTTGNGDFMSSAYLLHTRIDAPVSGPYTHDSSSVYSPVGDFAAAWRLSPKLVVGIGLQPVTGAGANFSVRCRAVMAVQCARQAWSSSGFGARAKASWKARASAASGDAVSFRRRLAKARARS